MDRHQDGNVINAVASVGDGLETISEGEETVRGETDRTADRDHASVRESGAT